MGTDPFIIITPLMAVVGVLMFVAERHAHDEQVRQAKTDAIQRAFNEKLAAQPHAFRPRLSVMNSPLCNLCDRPRAASVHTFQN